MCDSLYAAISQMDQDLWYAFTMETVFQVGLPLMLNVMI